MSCPTLADLPPPPPGKAGWPWTVESAQTPASMEGGRAWPRISIVTPSYNQGQFIEETIRSILLQGYPAVEYIVMDGGSADRSVEIIRKYERWITFWETQGDRGQAHAINKGFARATGDIFAWLNSDDTYEPGAFRQVAEHFHMRPDVSVLSGRCLLRYGGPDDPLIGPSPLRTYEDFLSIRSNWMRERLIIQPEAFFRASAYQRFGPLREDLQYCLDAALWMEMARGGCKFDSLPEHWANLRMHSEQKTADPSAAYSELARIAWANLIRDGSAVGSESTAIAEDIFGAMAGLEAEQRAKREALQNSTSYRIGRMFTQFKR